MTANQFFQLTVPVSPTDHTLGPQHAPVTVLEYADFDGFVRAKTLWHDELAELKESTLQRMRRNVFTMLREAELLSKGGEIMPALLSERIAAVLSAELRFFPTRQGTGQ